MKSLQPGMQILHTLSPRDRAALLWLGVFAIVMLLFYGVLQPTYRYYQDGRERLQDNRELLIWVQQNAERAAQLSRQPQLQSRNSGDPLMKQVSDSAENLTLDRVQPESDKLRVWINQAKFQDVLRWLTVLARDRQIHAEQIAIELITTEQAAKPGLVKVQVSFK